MNGGALLTNRVALVTGSSHGIGQVLAEGLANSMTQLLARASGADQIGLNAVCLGLTPTVLTAELMSGQCLIRCFIARLLTDRIGRPEGVVDLVPRFASDASHFFTGALNPLDGAHSIQREASIDES